MKPEHRALLTRVLLLLNSMPRFSDRARGVDSYDLAAEISNLLRETK